MHRMKTRVTLRVHRLMHEPRLSQDAVARRIGVSQTRYWQIENGYGPDPTPDEKSAVAAVLGVKVSDIVWPDVRVKAS